MKNPKKRRIEVPKDEPFGWLRFNTLMVGLLLVVLAVFVQAIQLIQVIKK